MAWKKDPDCSEDNVWWVSDEVLVKNDGGWNGGGIKVDPRHRISSLSLPSFWLTYWLIIPGELPSLVSFLSSFYLFSVTYIHGFLLSFLLPSFHSFPPTFLIISRFLMSILKFCCFPLFTLLSLSSLPRSSHHNSLLPNTAFFLSLLNRFFSFVFPQPSLSPSFVLRPT